MKDPGGGKGVLWLWLRDLLPLRLKRILLQRVYGYPSPYQEAFDRLGCIFIHIPKTGGVSVSTALFGGNFGHRTIDHFENFDPGRCRDYFKFTFVRNPWDRLVSAFHFMKEGGRNPQDQAWADEHLAGVATFSDFLHRMTRPGFAGAVLREQHFMPQWKYVCSPDRTLKMDFVGRFERLEEDFKKIANTLDLEAELPRYNIGEHRDYRAYYRDREMIRLVGNYYQDDIDVFDYDFGD